MFLRLAPQEVRTIILRSAVLQQRRRQPRDVATYHANIEEDIETCVKDHYTSVAIAVITFTCSVNCFMMCNETHTIVVPFPVCQHVRAI